MALHRSFSSIEGDFCREPVVARLLHSWEARNFRRGNALMGLELLLIDLKGATMQGFVAASRIFRFESTLKAGGIYKLNKFTLVPARDTYKVSDNKSVAVFSDQTTLAEIDGTKYEVMPQAFRIRNYKELSLIADRNGDLFDILGRIKHVTGDDLGTPAGSSPIAEQVSSKSKERVVLHVELTDGVTIRVYVWDRIAEIFRSRWSASTTKPVVLLMTTINPKSFSGEVTLSTTSATRMFFDRDIPETSTYLASLGEASLEGAKLHTSSSLITKLETVTIAEIDQFLKSEISQTINFYCVATIKDVNSDAHWNYISCTGCKNKMWRSGTTLVCTNEKCVKPSNVGLTRYRFEIAVNDSTGSTNFVVFDDVGKKLAGQSATELIHEISDASITDEGETNSAIPQCLLDTIGNTYKFQIKLTPYNFTAKRQTITVSRLLEATTDVNTHPGTDAGPSTKPSESASENEGLKPVGEKDDSPGSKKQRCG